MGPCGRIRINFYTLTPNFVVKLVFFTLIVTIVYKLMPRRPASKWDALIADNKINGSTFVRGQTAQLLINTSGCQLEKIEPFDARYPDTQKHFKVLPQEPCIAQPLTVFKDGVLRIDNITRRKYFPDVTRCHYKPFELEMATLNDIKYGPHTEMNMCAGNKIDHPQILVECTAAAGEEVY